MDTRAAMALIFRPGFSTQEEVTMDAGRGVGMDVVARSVYGAGRQDRREHEPGQLHTVQDRAARRAKRQSTAVA